MSVFALPIFDQVTRANVDALLAGEALAIWIKGFLPAEHCDHVYERVRATSLTPLPIHFTREDGTPDYFPHANVSRPGVDAQLDEYFDRLGSAGDAATPEARRAAVASMMDAYLAHVGPANELNAGLCAPFRRPCDVLFDHVNERCGIRVAAFDGRPMKFGTFLLNRRSERFDDPATVPIHVDTVPSALFPEIRAQLGAMVYCRVPSVGGELRVYDHPLVPRDAPIPAGVDHSVAYRALKPSAGDAILINSRRPHAVIPGGDGDRLANIMFIGSSGGYPLDIWT
ncbi:MAG: hypothetical protein Q8S73_35650 [Deltaproteobacteria bacterium]|nr:hypothetical protein [Myxococcales bacterium]MDP3219491.1 hypothetical protein [Deltaproteobacteria bacterium]